MGSLSKVSWTAWAGSCVQQWYCSIWIDWTFPFCFKSKASKCPGRKGTMLAGVAIAWVMSVRPVIRIRSSAEFGAIKRDLFLKENRRHGFKWKNKLSYYLWPLSRLQGSHHLSGVWTKAARRTYPFPKRPFCWQCPAEWKQTHHPAVRPSSGCQSGRTSGVRFHRPLWSGDQTQTAAAAEWTVERQGVTLGHHMKGPTDITKLCTKRKETCVW